jgi:hypothetical protein
MDLLLVRYTTFVWAPYNLSLISSGDMGLFFYNMFWILGVGRSPATLIMAHLGPAEPGFRSSLHV